MRLKKGSGKNFEDRTGKEYWPSEEAEMAAWRLENAVEITNIRYRRKKEEGKRDFWQKKGLKR